jgi:acyl-CoA thioester hydrolase
MRMEPYIKPLEVRWSDLDPNFHLRHSVYYDYGAYVRISFLESHGITTGFMAKNNFGPILFREECVFKREIRMGDAITIDMQLLKAREDQSRWTIQHHIFKKNNEIAAILTLDGAWFDVHQRKLIVPPAEVKDLFGHMPRAANFEWINTVSS